MSMLKEIKHYIEMHFMAKNMWGGDRLADARWGESKNNEKIEIFPMKYTHGGLQIPTLDIHIPQES